ncbi:10088_t:CDS:2 [Ambispora gerdemannii]|uniref:glutathione-specific gamma-glutamylcyclotransferase n=1 Tax=Ambispora gerdemannii TaxID=144530 RepID=A0A9N8WA14_9GLOM|nr:10088_t:CDS:2 [Ambispora gerdemannii]
MVNNESSCTAAPGSEYWIFGYGSLIWKPPPVYADRVAGFIKGHVRRFWQKNTDHRGTVDKPGLVVTLIPHAEWKLLDDYHHNHEDDVTWGVAYRIADKDVEDVKAELDFRESGYICRKIDVFQNHRVEPVVKNAIVYIATKDNEEYVGPAPIESIAQQIFTARGPSGPNIDYLINLAKALRIIAPETQDYHLFDLEQRVLRLERQKQLFLENGKEHKTTKKVQSIYDSHQILNNNTNDNNYNLSSSIMEFTSFLHVSRRKENNLSLSSSSSFELQTIPLSSLLLLVI